MILVIDNYDSFVHNLARYFRQLDFETCVVRNDELEVSEIEQMDPQAIVISPGPCTPNESGCCLDVVAQLGDRIPILGVCLGHQAIIQSFGGIIENADQPIHGRSTQVDHNADGIFRNVPTPFTVGRYHSLIANSNSLPECLTVSAQTSDGIIMAVAHRQRPIFGVQFHPESILTEHGYLLLRNFVELAGISSGLPSGASSQ